MSTSSWQMPPFTLTLVGATLVAYAVLAQLGWPGDPSPCRTATSCWCEPVGSGWVLQPWNTGSNLPALLAAVGLAGMTADGPRERTVRGAFIYALWAAGAGALFFHGSLTRWSQDLDQISIFLIWGAVLSTSLFRLGAFAAPRLPLVVAASSLTAVALVQGGVDINVLGLSCLGTFGILEVLWRRRVGAPEDPRWFRLALGAFAVAMVSWVLSLPGSFACSSPVPTHALWHVAVAVALVALSQHAIRHPVVGRAPP